jgi:CBS-domain-containing membrane protein
VPDLKALRLHNGTVYRWNRPCYGVVDNVPHLRIEARMLPSGPTVRDEMANAAFWLGLVRGLEHEVGDVRPRLRFDAAHENFLAAARLGLRAPLQWLDGSLRVAVDLVRDELVPLARLGLADLGVSGDEIERYLPVIAGRAETRRNGAQWQLDSLARLHGRGKKGEILGAVVASALVHQKNDEPVHTWPLADLRRDEPWQHHYSRVADLMSTELYTVSDEEAIDLVASLMDWRHIHNIPVENENHELVGLVSHRDLLRFLAQKQDERVVPVHEVMTRNPVCVTPETPSLEAIRLLKEHKITALPVIDANRLVGIVTEHDFLKVADTLLEDFFGLGSKLAKLTR